MDGDETNGTATVDDGEELDPRQAAALLEESTKEAKRRFDTRPALLMAIAAVTVVVVYGALWWSVRDQHPYTGPAGWALGVLYGVLAVWIVVVVAFRRRARSGISGPSERQNRIVGVPFAVAWVCVYVFQGALEHAGASHAIVYGIYPATAPFIVVGAAAAAYEAARDSWWLVGVSLAAVVLGAVAAYTGPRDVWAVMGIGVAVLILIYAVVSRLRPA